MYNLLMFKIKKGERESKHCNFIWYLSIHLRCIYYSDFRNWGGGEIYQCMISRWYLWWISRVHILSLSFYLFIYYVFVSLVAGSESFSILSYYLFMHVFTFYEYTHLFADNYNLIFLSIYLWCICSFGDRKWRIIIYLCMYLLFMITRICLQELKILIILPTYSYIHVFCSFGWRNSKFHHFILISNMHVTIYHICIAFILWWYLQSSYLFFLMLFLFLWLQEVRGSEL